MIAYLLLAAAIVVEVVATLSLRVAAAGRPAFYGIVLVGYTAAFGLLLIALRQGMPLGIAYGIWTAAGVALAAVASKYLFSDPLTRRMVAGIGFVIAGVLLIELGRH